MVQLVDESIKCPKELNDVRKALVGIVEDVKAKKDLVVIAGENLQALSDAIAGLEKVGEEFKDALPESLLCLGLLTSEVAGILLKKEEAPAA